MKIFLSILSWISLIFGAWCLLCTLSNLLFFRRHLMCQDVFYQRPLGIYTYTVILILWWQCLVNIFCYLAIYLLYSLTGKCLVRKRVIHIYKDNLRVIVHTQVCQMLFV